MVEELGSSAEISMHAGDTLVIETPGGGGFGKDDGRASRSALQGRALQRDNVQLNPWLWSLPPSSQNADHFARIGTGEQATPILHIGKPACVQVVDGFAHPGGAANQQNPHLFLAGSQWV